MHGHGPEFAALAIITVIFSIGAVVAYILQRFQLPTFLGFILTGMILGPSALNLVQAEEIQTLAQIGIIFLLFIVGLDLSVDKLRQLRYQAPLAGVLQLLFTSIALTLALRYLAGLPLQLSFLLGAILALSSTAIVLKSLEDHREIDSDHGRLILGVLIVQDLFIIPLMALVPSLTHPLDPSLVSDLAMVLGKALLFGAIAVFLSLKIVPVFLDRLASSNKKEVFTLALVCIGLGMALITHLLGLSYEAGAFVAGLALSRSLFCQQVIADSKAFRDVFITLFFVSMGLLFDIQFLIQHFPLVIAATSILMVIKAVCAYLAVRTLWFPHRTAMWAGLSLFQVGEFSFVLLGRTLDTVGQIPDWQQALSFWNPVLINAIIISMFLTPLVMRWLHKITAPERKTQANLKSNPIHLAEEIEKSIKRVIIAGYGPTAKHLASTLEQKGIPYTVVETNAQTIRKLKSKGISCLYGDISRPDILHEAGIHVSSILAITFPDVRAAEAAVQQAKQMNPNLFCIVRSRYRVDVERLHKLGVDSVIYEEFEASISFIFNVMNQLQCPIMETDRLITQVRQTENALHKEDISRQHPVFGRFSLLEGTQIEWIEINPACELAGKTLQESNIRQRTGVNIIAVIPAESSQQVTAEPNLKLNANDVLIGVGNPSQLQALETLLYK